MTGQLDHRRFQELLGVFALHALDDDERAAVERHLEECPRCRQEVDAHREIAAALGHDIEPLPPHLWDRINSVLPDAPPRSPELTVVPAAAGSHPAPSVLRPTRRHRMRAATTTVAVAAVAAAAAVVVLGLSLAHTDAQLSRSQQALGTSRSVVQKALATPGHRVVSLRTGDGIHVATVVLVPDGHGYMLDSTMPALAGGRTYQLWAVVNGTPISLGLLGRHPAVAAFTVGSAKVTELAVTIEPAGGVQAPTVSPVATAPL